MTNLLANRHSRGGGNPGSNFLRKYISAYLRERPAFMSFIRPQEALLFQKHSHLIDSPVLDFGCGDGFFAQVVFGKHKLDIGLEVDNNPRIEEAKKRNVYKKILLYDGLAIPLKNNSVRTVISNCVFEHIPNISSSVNEIYRVLKKGGYCITSVMTSDWSDMMLGTKLFGQNYAKWMNKRQEHESILSKKQWRALFKKAGFTIVKEIGYVNERTAKWLDLFHYLSLPSLITYKLFKRWVLLPWVNEKLVQWVETWHAPSLQKGKFAAYFYILRK
ncbi:class I SAM-dependent methyltransferase [Candidatus Roizmanbacteria bacterium]|nr:class I SAM-dependent methyltransferase [Candidatus Roizmanbacteria bacterium]